MKTAYLNGCIYTGQLPIMEAFLEEDGYFSKVGSNEEIAAMEAFLSDSDSYNADPRKYKDFSDALPDKRAQLERAVDRWAELEERLQG